MISTKIVFLCLVLNLCFLMGTFSTSTCQNLTPIKVTDERACQGRWYLYASSKRCDNCCFIRYGTHLGPDIFKLTDSLKRPEDTTAKVTSYIVQRKGRDAHEIGNVTKHVIPLNMDYNSHAVLYNEEANSLNVFTRNPNQNEDFLATLDSLSICKLKVYKYNPDTACKN